jgi:hypothetical protein
LVPAKQSPQVSAKANRTRALFRVIPDLVKLSTHSLWTRAKRLYPQTHRKAGVAICTRYGFRIFRQKGARFFVLYYSRDCRRAGCGLDARANRRGTVNPLPAKRIPAHIRLLYRAYTDEAMRSLAAIMRQADAPPSARIRAIAILLDRGLGQAATDAHGRRRRRQGGHQDNHRWPWQRSTVDIDLSAPRPGSR